MHMGRRRPSSRRTHHNRAVPQTAAQSWRPAEEQRTAAVEQWAPALQQRLITLFSQISQREVVKPQSRNRCALRLHQSAFQISSHEKGNSFCQVRSLLQPQLYH